LRALSTSRNCKKEDTQQGGLDLNLEKGTKECNPERKRKEREGSLSFEKLFYFFCVMYIKIAINETQAMLYIA